MLEYNYEKAKEMKENSRLGKIRNFLHTLCDCLVFSWKTSPFYTVARIVTGLLPTGCMIAGAYMGKRVLDLLSIDRALPHAGRDLVVLLSALFVLRALKNALQEWNQYCRMMHEEQMQAKLSLFLMDRAVSVDIACFDSVKYCDAFQLASQNTGAMLNLTWNTVSFVEALVSFLSVFTLMCTANAVYGIAMTAASVPAAIVAVRYAKTLYQLQESQINVLRQEGYLQGIAMQKEHALGIRLYDAGKMLKTRYRNLWCAFFDKRRGVSKKQSIRSAFCGILPEFTAAGIGVHIAFRILHGTMTVGDYSLYTGFANSLWGNVYLLASAVMSIYDNHLKIDSFRALTQFRSEIVDEGSEELGEVHRIEFEDVSFTYPETSVLALSHVSFSVEKEEKIALVGVNGSGKSTLVKLLLRFYEPDSGRIVINGKALKEYRLDSVRRAFSVYFQDQPNYCFSMRDNIAIADEERYKETADQDVESVLKEFAADIRNQAGAGLDTFVMRFLSDSGIELSGGQHQKLALVRALYRRSPVLILDEPSSNLDPEAEHVLFQKLEEHMKGKIVIFTSHRLSTVSLADKIIVLEQGKVLEQGTQVELLRAEGRYAELFRYQSQKYEAAREEG
ncbi:MAG: ABC transporter ATP-binding protein/permease [Clostridium sp.]|nr:ABC transporter ATP-binding protein/permease [Clostridium sp.]